MADVRRAVPGATSGQLLRVVGVADLATMRPRSGGLYPMVHDALGHYAGFITGWSDWITTCGCIAHSEHGFKH